MTRELLPLHFRLATTLRSRILTGELLPGTRLATEHELTRRYGVSRLTVRRAKARLIAEGLLRSVQGSGTYLTPPERWKASPFAIETIDDLLAVGRDMAAAFRMREFRMVPNSAAIAEKLANPADRTAARHLRVRPGAPVLVFVLTQYREDFHYHARLRRAG